MKYKNELQKCKSKLLSVFINIIFIVLIEELVMQPSICDRVELIIIYFEIAK